MTPPDIERLVRDAREWFASGGQWEDERDAAEARATQAEQRAEAEVKRLTRELTTVRDVLNTDLKISSDRVLTLELENQRLTRGLAETRDAYRTLCEFGRTFGFVNIHAPAQPEPR